ncbi:hypothetical protein GMORB2_3794 [Geosmithia morbida]|uniref:Uncharacterized protein n=1 Tax=Geosmithia morbida TaxID=1094350 RepID=A0A9P5D6N8_9HYPO|nr:uncharacterized protein GMORB2_3794 [Geosmithia morbida]KAF4124955.1 hypothetical protein GMORB2_3794 [Geosmithia morbida]
MESPHKAAAHGDMDGQSSDDTSSCYDEFELDNIEMGQPSLSQSPPAVNDSKTKPVPHISRLSHALSTRSHRRPDIAKNHKRGHPRKAPEMLSPPDTGMHPWMPPAARKRLLGAGAPPSPGGFSMNGPVPPRISSLGVTPGSSSFYHAALRGNSLSKDDGDDLYHASLREEDQSKNSDDDPDSLDGLSEDVYDGYEEPDFSSNLVPNHQDQNMPTGWATSLRELVDETNRIIKDAASLSTAHTSSDMDSRPAPEDVIYGTIPDANARLAPSPLALRRPRSSYLSDLKYTSPASPPSRAPKHSRSATISADINRNEPTAFTPPPGRPRGVSSPVQSGPRYHHTREASLLSVAVPSEPMRSSPRVPALGSSTIMTKVQRHTSTRLRRPSRASKWAMPENMTEILNGNVFRRAEVDELLTPKQLELLKLRRELAQRTVPSAETSDSRTSYRAAPSPNLELVEEDGTRREHQRSTSAPSSGSVAVQDPASVSSAEVPGSPSTLAPDGDDSCVHLNSTPFSALTPGFRHGTIALTKRSKRVVPGLYSIDEKAEWTAFQMAMLGSWDLNPDDLDDSDGKLAGDLAEWMGDLGFETHGGLVSQAPHQQSSRSPDRRSQATISSSSESSVRSGLSADSRHFHDHATRLSLAGNERYVRWPGEDGLKSVDDELRVVGHDIVDGMALPEKGPTTNLEQDLSDFLQWKAQRAAETS